MKAAVLDCEHLRIYVFYDAAKVTGVPDNLSVDSAIYGVTTNASKRHEKSVKSTTDPDLVDLAGNL
ncbi:hypothetical protein J6590_000919 [Homalodisca vitripennis]|nr:hypothetical protein J6590_000919 [Homalodisca vitripennis]